MLFNKASSFAAQDIVTMKLVNGDEIVAEIVSDDMTAYTVRRPQTVVPSAKGMGLMPSLFTASEDATITISKQHVMLIAPSLSEMERHYKQTTSGIDLLPPGSVLK